MSNIKTREEIIEIIYNAFIERCDSVIGINNPTTKESIYFISSSIDESDILLSLCAGNKSFGNKFHITDLDGIHDWISDIVLKLLTNEENEVNIDIKNKYYIDDENIQYFEENIAEEFSYFKNDIEDEEEIEIPDGYYDLVDYRMDYLTKHNQMKLFQKPIEIETKREAITLFGDFLENDRCNKMIFALSILISDLKTKFCIDLVIDKIYTYGRTFITFILVRPDMCDMDFKDPSDTLLEYDDRYIYSKDELIIHFSKVISSCFYRCSKMSKENIKIEVYSNTRIS